MQTTDLSTPHSADVCTPPAIPGWTYQAPTSTTSDPAQRYYRGDAGHNMLRGQQWHAGHPEARLMSWVNDAASARLTLGRYAMGEISADLTPAQLRTLRDALNDCLQDIAEAEVAP